MAVLRRNIQFSEVQQFRQGWLWAMIIFSTMISLVPLLVLTLQGEIPPREGILVMGIVVAVTAVILVLLNMTKLETKISDEGIAYRWLPFFSKFKLIRWSDVDHVQMEKYSGLSYGFHISVKYGRMHNVDGNQGFRVVLQNGKKYFFGTQKKLAAESALQQSGKMKL